MVTAARAKSSLFVRLGWLGVSLLVVAGGVALNVTHQRTDYSSYRSDEIDFAIRAMFFCIMLSGLCGVLGSVYGHTWRAAIFGLATPMIPVFCGATFALLVASMYKLSDPIYTELVTQGSSMEVYRPQLPANFRCDPPQRINGSPSP